jgi:hypothetical protein
MNAQGGLLLLPCMLHGDEDTNPHASAELVVVHDPAGDQGQDTTKTLASRYDGVTEEFDLHTAWPVANKKRISKFSVTLSHDASKLRLTLTTKLTNKIN